MFATHKAVNDIRHNPLDISQYDAVELLKQCAREGVRGHHHSTGILDGSFCRRRRLSNQMLMEFALDATGSEL